ncbi:hypothetical protein [Parafrankia colletiae]|uniref:hypothetical protein n=1 Tax=Parafrankia colletiae TaxID=573497 RepID=UPI0018E3DBC8|nr:hypothetical protein [Parafrankia colletiae]
MRGRTCAAEQRPSDRRTGESAEDAQDSGCPEGQRAAPGKERAGRDRHRKPDRE